MANTSNIGLAKLEGTEKLKTFPTTFNSDMDTIDTVVGNDVGTSRTISQAITRTEEGIAIVANGNTHSAISSGQYVYVKNHGSLAEGLYTAASNISANATLSGSNLTAVSGGGLNSVYNALNSKITTITYNVINPLNGYFTKRDAFRARIKCGVVVVESYINFTTEIPANTEFASIETTGIYGSYIVINTSTRAVYYASLRNTGRFTSETAIPTGYYYFVGCAI